MVFDKEYSALYDSMYAAKDYAGECAYVEKLFRKAGLRPATILDLGCGTGSHAVPLAAKGYKVTGVDRSPGMLAAAVRKAAAAGVKARFVKADIARMPSPGKFDAVLCMFAVMGYQLSNKEAAAVCRLARKSLKPGGIFIFDCWYGPGVLACPPGKRVRTMPGEKGEKIIRRSEPELDAFKHTVRIRITLTRVKKGAAIKTAETHEARFFFPQEIKYFLEEAGFKKIDIYPFMATGRRITASDWNMAVAAR